MIRPAQDGDLTAILRLVDAWPSHFVESAKPLINRDFQAHNTIVFVKNEKVTGFLIWSIGNREIELRWLAVDPDHTRNKIGSGLVRHVMSSIKTENRIVLRTATTDSIISGTGFQGEAYEATHTFFERLGFLEERIIRDYWGESNHCLVLSRKVNPLNPLLANLAEFVRPIEKVVGRAYGITNAYIGVAFRWDTRTAAFFAEYIPKSRTTRAQATQYANDEYMLPSHLKFVQTVLDEQDDEVNYQLEDPGAGHAEVEGDVRIRWNHVKNVHILRVPLFPGNGLTTDVVLYFVTRTSRFPNKSLLKKSGIFISQALRTALFLAVSSRHGIEQIRLRNVAQKLASMLPGNFPEYEDYFGNAMDDFANPSAWFTHGFATMGSPKSEKKDHLEGELSDDEKRILSAIKNAEKVTIIGKPEGSFQGRAMMFVRIDGRDLEGESHGGSYEGVVKEVDVEKAQKEQAGYQLAQFYFNEIRFALPPASILWPIKDNEGELCRRYAAVIPRVSGQTLSSYISEQWHSFQSATESQGDHFGRMYRLLVKFIRGLGQGDAGSRNEVAHQCIYDSHFSLNNEARRRLPKTKDALGFYLAKYRGEPTLRFNLLGATEEVVNPLWVLTSAAQGAKEPKDDTYWSDTSLNEVKRVDFCHGDFHSGNILVHQDGTVTVLDYDYVGRDRQFSDIATLEASVLLSLASAKIFRDQSEWLTVFPSLLSGLAKQASLGSIPPSLLGNQDAFNAWRVLQIGRVWVAESDSFSVYRALLVSALLRLITSNHGLLDDKREYHPGLFSSAIFYLGSLLKTMVKTPDQAEQIPEINLFNQPLDLTREPLDSNPQYCRQYFRWLAKEAKKNTEASGSRDKLSEYIEELCSLANNNNAPESKASMLRFGLRLARNAELSPLVKNLTAKLAELYLLVSNDRPEPEKSLLAGWATRYNSDGQYSYSKAQGSTSPEVWHGVNKSSQPIRVGNWRFSGLTHSGHTNSKGEPEGKNADAFLLLERDDGSFLLAVADGTGDSKDGERASQIALQALANAWKSKKDIAEAVTETAQALQEDNRQTQLDGASTLVAVELNRNDAQVVNFGDTRFYLISENGEEQKAEVELLTRQVLGGEPLGDIITSGGNLVREIRECPQGLVTRVPDVTKIVLTSDGTFFLDNPEDDFNEIKEIINHHSTPEKAAEDILQRSLDAFRLGEAKGDNVTVIVGFRND